MRRNPVWIAILGGLLILGNALTAAQTLSYPTDLILIKIAEFVSALSWIGLGGFLVAIYVKKIADTQVPEQAVPDSTEDIENLNRKNRWILGFVLLSEILGTIPSWIINNYGAGATLVNIEMIYDLVVNVLVAIVTIELFRGKRDVKRIALLTVFLLYFVEGVFAYVRIGFFEAIAALPTFIYFAFALTAPMNRKNFRIANFVLLPIGVVGLLILGSLGDSKLNSLMKAEMLLEQQYATETGSASAAYNLFLQKEVPGSAEILPLRNSIREREIRGAQLISKIGEIQVEYEKQLPNVDRVKVQERLPKLIAIFGLHRAQTDKIKELLDYMDSIDVRRPSNSQEEHIVMLKQDIDDFNDKITEAQFKMDNQ